MIAHILWKIDEQVATVKLDTTKECENLDKGI